VDIDAIEFIIDGGVVGTNGATFDFASDVASKNECLNF